MNSRDENFTIDQQLSYSLTTGRAHNLCVKPIVIL